MEADSAFYYSNYVLYAIFVTVVQSPNSSSRQYILFASRFEASIKKNFAYESDISGLLQEILGTKCNNSYSYSSYT